MRLLKRNNKLFNLYPMLHKLLMKLPSFGNFLTMFKDMDALTVRPYLIERHLSLNG